MTDYTPEVLQLGGAGRDDGASTPPPLLQSSWSQQVEYSTWSVGFRILRLSTHQPHVLLYHAAQAACDQPAKVFDDDLVGLYCHIT